MTDETFLARFETASLPSFDHRDPLLAHDSRERLFSGAARAAFVEPGLLALP